jgi:hypothetical protein
MICAPRSGVGGACQPFDPNKRVLDPGCALDLFCEVVGDEINTCQ